MRRWSRLYLDGINLSEHSLRSCLLRKLGWLMLILTCSMTAAGAQSRVAPLVYADDLEAVGRRATTSHIPIMLVFTRPDCPYCAGAKSAHLEALSAAQSAKVVLREIEAGNDSIPLRDFQGSKTTHGEFARQYEVRVVPTVIVVDSAGKLLADAIVGLNGPDFYDLYLEQAIDAARLQLRTR